MANINSKTIMVNSTGLGYTPKEKSVFKFNIFSKTININLDNAMPANIPAVIHPSATITISQKTILVICFFSIPNTLYSPNSLLLLFIKNPLV